MAFIFSVTRRASDDIARTLATVLAGLLATGGTHAATPACKGRLYLTLDTGHMQPAEEIAAILNKHAVRATFFLANEKTWRGDGSLDPAWTAFWRARAVEGHAFGSHTWRHWYLRGDIGSDKLRYLAWGARDGEVLDAVGFCEELKKSEEAFRKMTGRGFDGLWRAPGGKLTANAERFAAACGYRHVGWSPAGFSGDELPSEKYPADRLIAAQLRDLRDGDILLWHLGIRSRREPLYPMLDTLIAGLKEKGYCFATIPDHPRYARQP